MAASLARRAASSTWPGCTVTNFRWRYDRPFPRSSVNGNYRACVRDRRRQCSYRFAADEADPSDGGYFANRHLRTLRRWQPKLWLGFSAERQGEFDARWQDMRLLANAGWVIFASIAPLIGPVKIPSDFLALRDRSWVIVAGEQGRHDCCRDMQPNWARAIRDQCAASGIAFFMKQMARKEPIPPDLLIREFPQGGRHDERYPFGAA